jgi:hypothetical protein
MMRSSHHGVASRPNELRAAKRLLEKQSATIDVVEIDFVAWGAELISAHDYDAIEVARGSPLLDWILLVIVAHRKVLWIDLKARFDASAMLGCSVRFDARLVIDTLSDLRARIKSLDILPFIWLSCQESHSLALLAAQLQEPWILSLDLPSAWSYGAKMLLPGAFHHLVDERVQWDVLCRQFSQDTPVVSLDRSFFGSLEQLRAVIDASTIPSKALVVLYTFARSDERMLAQFFRGARHRIVFQFDYVLI